MEFEFCIDSLDAALLANKYGADRVELCAALYEGGLTPSQGLIKACVEHSNQAVFVMIRPEAGGFHYAASNIEIMKADIINAAALGAKGVVFGLLQPNNEIDFKTTQALTKLAKQHQLQTVFHRAFDFCINPISSLERLIDIGIDRLLTSGQQAKAIQGLELIQQLVSLADGRIEIMAGSGVRAENAKAIMDTGVNALHFTAVKMEEKVRLGMGVKYILDEDKVSSIMKFKNH